MKLLLDENLPHQLRYELPEHDCVTVTYMGWSGIENGELLSRATAEGFEAVLTKDANVEYQQDLARLPIAVVVLHAESNDLEDIRPLLPALHGALSNLPARQVTHLF